MHIFLPFNFIGFLVREATANLSADTKGRKHKKMSCRQCLTVFLSSIVGKVALTSLNLNSLEKNCVSNMQHVEPAKNAVRCQNLILSTLQFSLNGNVEQYEECFEPLQLNCSQ